MPNTRHSLRVKVDIAKNRLYIFIAGAITKQSLDQFFTEVRFGISDLKTNFHVITDLTKCHMGHLSAIPTFVKIMHYVSSQGAKEVIRIVDNKSLIYPQAINLAAKIQGYSPRYVTSMDEAEELLESTIRRDSLRFNLINKEIEVTVNPLSSTHQLINMSTSGCATKSDKTIPVGQEAQIKLSLAGKKSGENHFEIDAVSSRVLEEGVAFRFVEMEDSDKQMLWECLVHESKLGF